MPPIPSQVLHKSDVVACWKPNWIVSKGHFGVEGNVYEKKKQTKNMLGDRESLAVKTSDFLLLFKR